MLVLGRKRGERILIGHNIEIVITEVRGEKVRLGFNAPDDVPIHREEVFHRIEAECNHSPLMPHETEVW